MFLRPRSTLLGQCTHYFSYPNLMGDKRWTQVRHVWANVHLNISSWDETLHEWKKRTGTKADRVKPRPSVNGCKGEPRRVKFAVMPVVVATPSRPSGLALRTARADAHLEPSSAVCPCALSRTENCIWFVQCSASRLDATTPVRTSRHLSMTLLEGLRVYDVTRLGWLMSPFPGSSGT